MSALSLFPKIWFCKCCTSHETLQRKCYITNASHRVFLCSPAEVWRERSSKSFKVLNQVWNQAESSLYFQSLIMWPTHHHYPTPLNINCTHMHSETYAHINKPTHSPWGSCVGSIKPIFHSQFTNRSCSVLGSHSAAGCTIDPVKAHTYKLAPNGLSHTCVCACRSCFPPKTQTKDCLTLLFVLLT